MLLNREISSLSSPQLLLFPEGRQLLAKDVVNVFQCSLDDVNNVNNPLNITLSAGWTKDGEVWSRWRGGEEAQAGVHEGSGGINKSET